MDLFDDLGTVFTGVFGGGEAFTIQTESGARTVAGIFRESDQIYLPGDDFEGVVAPVSTLRIRRSEGAGIKDGDPVNIGGVPYVVRAPMDDGRAMIVLRLERVP